MRVMEIISHHHRKGFGYSTASFTLLQNEHFSGSKAKQHRDQNPAIQYRTSPLTSMASSFVIEREEKFAFAKCRQKPTTRRIFTFQTVGLLLIFQRSQSQCLTQSVCVIPASPTCAKGSLMIQASVREAIWARQCTHPSGRSR